MESSFIILIPLLIIGVGIIAVSVMRSRQWNEVFKDLAARFGLTFSSGGFLSSPSVSGEIEGTRVQVFRKSFSHGKTSTRTIGFGFQFPPFSRPISVIPEGFLSRLTNDGDIEVNDADFDEATLISGRNAVSVRALLGPKARKIILRLIRVSYARKFTLAGDSLETYQEESRFDNAADLAKEILDVIDLGTILSRPGSDEELLRENFLAEKDNRCREAYFESLAAVAGRLDADDEAVRLALSSRHPPLEFEAIRAIGSKGDRFIPNVLARAESGLALRIIGYLEERRLDRLVPELTAAAKRVTDWEVKAALARFTAGTGHGEAEGFIRKLLESGSDGPGDFKRECIRALGRCGGKGSIEFLYYLKGAFIRREIDEAIAAIRARLGLKETGQLSLQEPEPDGGSLSLAEGETRKGGKQSSSQRKKRNKRNGRDNG